ncbi:MAG: hypothetical protein KC422_06650 [Trueperaceae bacterium]|nr:hypothetical protein [Trueperaceae bacterium]
MTTKRLSLIVSSLLLSLALVACGSQKIEAKTPIVKDFLINNVSVQDNFGFIVTSAQDILFKADTQNGSSINRLTIYAKKDDGDYSTLTECSSSNCEYLWSVSAVNNGVYSFLVEAEDERGATSALPYRNALSISIR